MTRTIAPSGNAAWRWLEQGFDRAFGASGNPLRLLGALLFLCFAVLLVSGAWLYAGYDTSVRGAHASVARLTESRWSMGALMHSLHRYATDAFVILTVLHLVRELLRPLAPFSTLLVVERLRAAAVHWRRGHWRLLAASVG